MNQLLFGGSKGVLFQNYLLSLSHSIECYIENEIDVQLSNERLTEAIIEKFTLKSIQFDSEKAKIRIVQSGSTNFKAVTVPTPIKINKYICEIPFQGDATILKYKPLVFHDHEISYQVIVSTKSSFSELALIFKSEEKPTVQFNCFKNQIFNNINKNFEEINREIEDWNSNRIHQLILHILKKQTVYC